MTLKRSILELLRREYPNWVSSWRIEQLARELHYLSSHSTRRTRELAQEAHAERRIAKGAEGKRYAEYRYVPPVVEAEETEEDRQQKLLQLSTR